MDFVGHSARNIPLDKHRTEVTEATEGGFGLVGEISTGTPVASSKTPADDSNDLYNSFLARLLFPIVFGVYRSRFVSVFFVCLCSRATLKSLRGLCGLLRMAYLAFLRVFVHGSPSSPRLSYSKNFRDGVAGRFPGSRPTCIARLIPNQLLRWPPGIYDFAVLRFGLRLPVQLLLDYTIDHDMSNVDTLRPQFPLPKPEPIRASQILRC